MTRTRIEMWARELGTGPRSTRACSLWRLRETCCGVLLLLAGGAPSLAQEGWPGLWGPERDANLAGEIRLVPGDAWSEVWRRPLGKGYSEIVVAGKQGFVAFSDGDKDVLTSFVLETGKELWRSVLGATYRGHGGSEDGPISTPAWVEDRLVALNAHGRLAAFATADGRELWSRDLVTEFGGQAPHWGFATSPLVVGDAVVVQVGGAGKNSVVAFAVDSGEPRWTSGVAQKTGYASPVLGTLGGVRQIVAVTEDLLFGLDPANGSLLWSLPMTTEPRQSPILLPDNHLLVVNWEQARLLEVIRGEAGWQVSTLWQRPSLKSTLSPAVAKDGALFGMNGTYLVCLDLATGEAVWREKFYGGTILGVGGMLAIVGERSGNFHLVEASREGYRSRLEQKVFNPGARSLTGPTFLGERFLLRNGEEMVLLAPRAQAPSAPTGGSR